MLIDAHTHLDEAQLAALSCLPQNMRLMANAATREEARRLFAAKNARLLVSAGLHPWQADRNEVEVMLPFLERSAAIGEIGLDSVWCEVPLHRQEEVFCRQLELAQQMRKPVILHIKGCEEQAARLLSCFSAPKLIHWYSSPAHLDDYLDMDCYFTVGPDLDDPAVRQVALRAPLARLLIETDGLDAIAWATGRQVSMGGYAAFLKKQIDRVAALRGISPAELERQMEHTLCTFLGDTPL